MEFTYPQLEEANRSLHNIPVEGASKFKARVRNLQRIGLIPSAPGKGRRIHYDVVQAIRWALCFEFAEVGILPESIYDIFQLLGTRLFHPFQYPIEDEDSFLVLEGNFLEWYIAEAGSGIPFGQTRSGILSSSQVNQAIFMNPKISRLIIINLTELKRKLGEKLNIEWEFVTWVEQVDGKFLIRMTPGRRQEIIDN